MDMYSFLPTDYISLVKGIIKLRHDCLLKLIESRTYCNRLMFISLTLLKYDFLFSFLFCYVLPHKSY